MNYVSAVYAVILLIIALDWVIRGKRHYRGALTRHEEASAGVFLDQSSQGVDTYDT